MSLLPVRCEATLPAAGFDTEPGPARPMPTLGRVDDIAREVVERFVAAYRPYLLARLEAAGLPPVADAVTAGEAWLRSTLEDLLARPFADQERSPLEVFQEATRFASEALEALGLPAPERDPVAAAALPGDRFDLAPASSQPLGEEAWRAHLAWGAAKAAAHAAPSALMVSRNLLDASRVREVAERRGYAFTVTGRAPRAGRRYTVAFVDLEHPDADDAVRVLAATCGSVVAFGPHVDDFAMTRARTLGAREAVARSRFFSDPGAWLPQPV